MGGHDGRQYLNTVSLYDGSSWTSGPSMSVGRDDHDAVVYLGRIFVFGGYNGNYLTSVEMFDGSTWTAARPMIFPRQEHGAVVFSNKVYIMGGHYNTNRMTFVDVFDGNIWTRSIHHGGRVPLWYCRLLSLYACAFWQQYAED